MKLSACLFRGAAAFQCVLCAGKIIPRMEFPADSVLEKK